MRRVSRRRCSCRSVGCGLELDDLLEASDVGDAPRAFRTTTDGSGWARWSTASGSSGSCARPTCRASTSARAATPWSAPRPRRTWCTAVRRRRARPALAHRHHRAPTGAGKLYCAAVVDAHSRRIIGLSIAARQTSDIVVDALAIAVTRRNPPHRSTILHSDHGTQYTGCARYLVRPPWRLISRDTTDSPRPIEAAMSFCSKPMARPREISSRSAKVSCWRRTFPPDHSRVRRTSHLRKIRQIRIAGGLFTL
jgi:hypothetical protein